MKYLFLGGTEGCPIFPFPSSLQRRAFVGRQPCLAHIHIALFLPLNYLLSEDAAEDVDSARHSLTSGHPSYVHLRKHSVPSVLLGIEIY